MDGSAASEHEVSKNIGVNPRLEVQWGYSFGSASS